MSLEEERLPEYENGLNRVQGTVAEMLDMDIERGSLSCSDELGSFENVVVLLVDGFGAQYWKKHSDEGFFRKLAEHGDFREISAPYPSETAAATTSLYTGTTPSQHGLVGWYTYLEDFEAYIHSLPFRDMSWQRAEEEFEGLNVEEMIMEDSAFKLLDEEGVNCYTVIPEDIEDGHVSNHLFEGSEQIGYRGLADMSVKLRKKVQSCENSRNYFFVYISVIDKISHHEGTNSEEYRAQIAQVSHALDRNFLQKLDSKHGETAVVLTADHGFLDTDPEENIDLFSIEGVEESLREKSDGEKILPFGGPRNVHLKLREEKKQEIREVLERELEANIWSKEEALEKELFGKESSEDFERRIGDLIISPHRDALWYGDNSDELALIGHHGGLSRKEMEVPFVTANLEELLD